MFDAICIECQYFVNPMIRRSIYDYKIKDTIRTVHHYMHLYRPINSSTSSCIDMIICYSYIEKNII